MSIFSVPHPAKPSKNTLKEEIEQDIETRMLQFFFKKRPLWTEEQARKMFHLPLFNEKAFDVLKVFLHKSESLRAKTTIELIQEKNEGRVWHSIGPKLLTFFEKQEQYLSPISTQIVRDTIVSNLPPHNALAYYQSLVYLRNSIDKNRAITDSYIKKMRLSTVSTVLSWVSEILEENSAILPQQKDLQALNQVVSQFLTQTMLPYDFKNYLANSKPVIAMALDYIHKINHRSAYPNLNPAEFDKIIPDIRVFIRQGHKLFSNVDNMIDYRAYFHENYRQNMTSFFFGNDKFMPALLERSSNEEILKLTMSLVSSDSFRHEIRSLYPLKDMATPAYWSKALDKPANYMLKHNILLLGSLAPEETGFPKIQLPLQESDMVGYSVDLLNKLEAVFQQNKYHQNLTVLVAQKKLELAIAPVEKNTPKRTARHKI